MKTILKTTGILLACLVGFSLSSTAQKVQKKTAGFYDYETECLGVEGDGSQTVRVHGKGRNREDAIEQAKKNAVRDVLFTGISKGSAECNKKPLLFDPNAREKFEDYFNAFFADNGPYKEFITSEDGSDMHSEVRKGRSQAGSQENYGVVVRVQRAKLKERMIQDKIITQ
jgi:hypothetical protein